MSSSATRSQIQGSRANLPLNWHFGTFKEDGQMPEPAQRLGFSVGQGFVTGWGPGWMQLDTSYEHRANSGTEISQGRSDSWAFLTAQTERRWSRYSPSRLTAIRFF